MVDYYQFCVEAPDNRGKHFTTKLEDKLFIYVFLKTRCRENKRSDIQYRWNMFEVHDLLQKNLAKHDALYFGYHQGGVSTVDARVDNLIKPCRTLLGIYERSGNGKYKCRLETIDYLAGEKDVLTLPQGRINTTGGLHESGTAEKERKYLLLADILSADILGTYKKNENVIYGYEIVFSRKDPADIRSYPDNPKDQRKLFSYESRIMKTYASSKFRGVGNGTKIVIDELQQDEQAIAVEFATIPDNLYTDRKIPGVRWQDGKKLECTLKSQKWQQKAGFSITLPPEAYPLPKFLKQVHFSLEGNCKAEYVYIFAGFSGNIPNKFQDKKQLEGGKEKLSQDGKKLTLLAGYKKWNSNQYTPLQGTDRKPVSLLNVDNVGIYNEKQQPGSEVSPEQPSYFIVLSAKIATSDLDAYSISTKREGTLELCFGSEVFSSSRSEKLVSWARVFSTGGKIKCWQRYEISLPTWRPLQEELFFSLSIGKEQRNYFVDKERPLTLMEKTSLIQFHNAIEIQKKQRQAKELTPKDILALITAQDAYDLMVVRLIAVRISGPDVKIENGLPWERQQPAITLQLNKHGWRNYIQKNPGEIERFTYQVPKESALDDGLVEVPMSVGLSWLLQQLEDNSHPLDFIHVVLDSYFRMRYLQEKSRINGILGLFRTAARLDWQARVGIESGKKTKDIEKLVSETAYKIAGKIRREALKKFLHENWNTDDDRELEHVSFRENLPEYEKLCKWLKLDWERHHTYLDAEKKRGLGLALLSVRVPSSKISDARDIPSVPANDLFAYEFDKDLPEYTNLCEIPLPYSQIPERYKSFYDKEFVEYQWAASCYVRGLLLQASAYNKEHGDKPFDRWWDDHRQFAPRGMKLRMYPGFGKSDWQKDVSDFVKELPDWPKVRDCRYLEYDNWHEQLKKHGTPQYYQEIMGFINEHLLDGYSIKDRKVIANWEMVSNTTADKVTTDECWLFYEMSLLLGRLGQIYFLCEFQPEKCSKWESEGEACKANMKDINKERHTLLAQAEDPTGKRAWFVNCAFYREMDRTFHLIENDELLEKFKKQNAEAGKEARVRKEKKLAERSWWERIWQDYVLWTLSSLAEAFDTIFSFVDEAYYWTIDLCYGIPPEDFKRLMEKDSRLWWSKACFDLGELLLSMVLTGGTSALIKGTSKVGLKKMVLAGWSKEMRQKLKEEAVTLIAERVKKSLPAHIKLAVTASFGYELYRSAEKGEDFNFARFVESTLSSVTVSHLFSGTTNALSFGLVSKKAAPVLARSIDFIEGLSDLPQLIQMWSHSLEDEEKSFAQKAKQILGCLLVSAASFQDTFEMSVTDIPVMKKYFKEADIPISLTFESGEDKLPVRALEQETGKEETGENANDPNYGEFGSLLTKTKKDVKCLTKCLAKCPKLKIIDCVPAFNDVTLLDGTIDAMIMESLSKARHSEETKQMLKDFNYKNLSSLDMFSDKNLEVHLHYNVEFKEAKAGFVLWHRPKDIHINPLLLAFCEKWNSEKTLDDNIEWLGKQNLSPQDLEILLTTLVHEWAHARDFAAESYDHTLEKKLEEGKPLTKEEQWQYDLQSLKTEAHAFALQYQFAQMNGLKTYDPDLNVHDLIAVDFLKEHIETYKKVGNYKVMDYNELCYRDEVEEILDIFGKYGIRKY